jgi:RNA polymerase sigma-70 factor (ECF subfamily)
MAGSDTRKTLIARLRITNSDTRSWAEFYDLYWKLVYSVALKAGLSPSDAEDVVQETFLKVSKHIKKFEYDPHKGRFRNWLCLITKQQVANHYRKSKKLPELPSFWNEDPDKPFTEIPDPTNQWDDIWEAEDHKHTMHLAMTRLQDKVKPKQYQIFRAHCIKGMSVESVTEILEVSANEVYLAKSRVMPLFEEEVRALTVKDEG